jgi:Fe-S-cluster containining protein
MSMSVTEASALQERIAKTDPVDCDGCTACCRGNQAVCLREGDNPADYGDNLQLENYHGTPSLTLKRRANGDCVYLLMGVCTIYAKRPTVCRRFDCRRIVAMFDSTDRGRAIARGLFSAEIMDAGKARSGTLKLLPEEEGIYAKDARGRTDIAKAILGEV